MSIQRGVILAVLLLLLGVAGYWLLPAYVLPPLDISQRPVESADESAPVAPVTSYVSIPLALSVDRIQQLVREQLSGRLLADKINVPGRDLKVSIQRNGTLAIWVRDADLHMVLPLKFRTEGDLSTKGELTIFTRASFNVSRDWEPMVDARSTFRWDWQPRVGVWPFRFRIGDVLAPYIQMALDKGAEEFRSQTAGLYNLRTIAEGGWNRLHGPHVLDSVDKKWLVMTPRELYMEPITSDGSEVRLNVWMGGELGIVSGRPPAESTVTPLPRLRRGPPPARGISLSAPLLISYERMLTSLQAAMIGKTLPSSAGTLVLTGLELYSSGESIAVGISFKGQEEGSALPTRGRVYLVGQPEYDAETRTLSISNLKITEPTNDFLARGAQWVLQHAPSWVAELAPRLSWDAGPLLDEHRGRLGHLLNLTVNNRFDLWGDLAELQVSGARPHEEGVMLFALVKGNLELLFVP